jgi:hypothetical protein
MKQCQFAEKRQVIANSFICQAESIGNSPYYLTPDHVEDKNEAINFDSAITQQKR